MRIAYIARSAVGAMGEAALLHYVRKMSGDHDVLVVQHRSAEAKVTEVPANVKLTTVPDIPLEGRLSFVFGELQEFQPDIVHLIQSPYCFDYVMRIKPLLPGTKWILDFRSPHVGTARDPILRKFFHMQFFIDALLTHSMESLVTNIKWRFRKAYEIPPGVDQQGVRTSQRHSQLPERFVYVGSLSKTREIGFLVDAFAEFRRRHSNRVSLDLIGDGNDLAELRRHVEEKGMMDFIHFAGLMPQDALWQTLADYDAGIAYVPHRNFAMAPSLKAIEYIAAKLPVMASRTPGHEIFARKHNLAFQFFENELEDFCQSMTRFCEIPVSRDLIEQNHRNIQPLNWDRIIESHLTPVYKRLTRRR